MHKLRWSGSWENKSAPIRQTVTSNNFHVQQLSFIIWEHLFSEEHSTFKPSFKFSVGLNQNWQTYNLWSFLFTFFPLNLKDKFALELTVQTISIYGNAQSFSAMCLLTSPRRNSCHLMSGGEFTKLVRDTRLMLDCMFSHLIRSLKQVVVSYNQPNWKIPHSQSLSQISDQNRTLNISVYILVIKGQNTQLQ
jgi:hypothetical protein